MTRNSTVILVVGLYLFSSSALFGQEEIKPWEKYGLSQTEWKTIQEKHISLDKVQVLLSAGISISEYTAKPWKDLELTEREYIEKRRAGLTAYDIELEYQSKKRQWKGDGKATLQSELGAFSGNRELLLSFALPGYQQHRLDQKWRSRFMTGIAVGALAGTFLWSFADGSFEGTPLFLVLVPDMFWSAIDFKISLWRMSRE